MSHLIRKTFKIGGSRGVTLPKFYLDFFEKKYGVIEAVSMEVNGKITIRPIIQEAQKKITLKHKTKKQTQKNG